MLKYIGKLYRSKCRNFGGYSRETEGCILGSPANNIWVIYYLFKTHRRESDKLTFYQVRLQLFKTNYIILTGHILG